MKLKQIRALETALRRLEDGRDRIGVVAEEEPHADLIRLHKLVTLDVGTLRGLIGRLNHGDG